MSLAKPEIEFYIISSSSEDEEEEEGEEGESSEAEEQQDDAGVAAAGGADGGAQPIPAAAVGSGGAAAGAGLAAGVAAAAAVGARDVPAKKRGRKRARDGDTVKAASKNKVQEEVDITGEVAEALGLHPYALTQREQGLLADDNLDEEVYLRVRAFCCCVAASVVQQCGAQGVVVCVCVARHLSSQCTPGQSAPSPATSCCSAPASVLLLDPCVCVATDPQPPAGAVAR